MPLFFNSKKSAKKMKLIIKPAHINYIAPEIAAALIAGGAGIIGTGATAGANAGMTAAARRENFKYNEQAANNADMRTRQLYNDLQSPEAKVRQLKEAGLSVGLMYGNGGGISGSLSSGAQGAGTNGIGAAQFQGLDLANMINNARLTAAQIENIKADTEGKNINNNYLAQLNQGEINLKAAQVKLTESQADTEETKQAMNKAQTAYTQALTITENALRSGKIELINKDIQEADARIENWALENRKIAADLQVLEDPQVIETRKKEIMQQYQNMIATNAVLKAQKQLMEAEAGLTIQQTNYLTEKLPGYMETQTNAQKTQAEAYKDFVDFMSGEHFDMEQTQAVWNSINGSINAVGNLIGAFTHGSATSFLGNLLHWGKGSEDTYTTTTDNKGRTTSTHTTKIKE